MASFVHITDQRLLRDIHRGGIRPSKRDFGRYAPPGWPHRYVFCAPVLPTLEATFHWMREIAGPGRNRRGTAVQFRLPDKEMVLVGVYGETHRAMTAAEAVAAFLRSPWPRGMQVLVPRAIAPAEIQRVRHVPRFIGWRRSAFARLAPIPPPPGAAERRRRRRLAEAALARLAAEHPALWRRLAAAGLAEDQAWRQAWGGEFADTDDSRRSEVIADLTWTLDEMEAEAAGLPPPARED